MEVILKLQQDMEKEMAEIKRIEAGKYSSGPLICFRIRIQKGCH